MASVSPQDVSAMVQMNSWAKYSVLTGVIFIVSPVTNVPGRKTVAGVTMYIVSMQERGRVYPNTQNFPLSVRVSKRSAVKEALCIHLYERAC